ncbi:MAG: hypothetical protein A2V86_04760 [Deltaproteobacteria bacterium RBG_16_49_23]|nr:MAG: hypothetical protein A2V86_04760 [Deltaproteobacteria bacterium RBG_16_49_23]
MLAGINQKIFLNQWGDPDIRISLDRLQGYFALETMVLNRESGTEDFNTVWIYEKRNRIFFFKKGRLTSHFRWNEFKDKWNASQENTYYKQTNKSSSFRLMPLSLVA